MPWLTLSRTSPQDLQQRELYVSVDGRRVAILLYGDVATLDVSAGRHELRVHNTLSRKKLEFDAAPDQHVRFSTANVAGRGYAYWGMFVGAALMWTVVEREADGEPLAGPAPRTFRV